MSSLVLNALLSQCTDVCHVLDLLRWHGDALPDVERIESLSTVIGHILTSAEVCSDLKTSERFLCKVESMLWDQCVPLFKMISRDSSRAGSVAQNGKNKEMLSAAYGLLGACLIGCRRESLEKISSMALPALQLCETEAGHHEQLDIDVATEVMAVVLAISPHDTDLTRKTLSCSLRSVRKMSEVIVSKIIVRIWFTSIRSTPAESRSDLLHFIWSNLLDWYESELAPGVTARVLLCLTALSDYIFPLGPALLNNRRHRMHPDPVTSQTFFKLVQAGLTHRDSVSRKRALYLLKRCESLAYALNEDVCGCGTDAFLFRWTPDIKLILRRFWEDYALVMETLEENQIHVVRPVLTRIDTLVKTTAGESQDIGLVHPSWLLCVYQRMFHSENKAVMKEGVNHLLELHIIQKPAFAMAISQFVVGPFMDALSESSLYHRTQGQIIGDCPELGLKLQQFMETFFSSLPEENRGSVLEQLLQRLVSQHWCAVPLLFLSQALSCLPPCPVVRPKGLRLLREVLSCTMVTHQVLLRGATQCFLLHTALRSTCVSEVSLDEIFAFLSYFRVDESLCRGTALWRELCDWLLANEGSFRPAEDSTDSNFQNVSGYIAHHLKTFLTVPASSDQIESVPDPGEAEALARVLLLSADMDLYSKKRRGDGLKQLLCPLLDVLQRLSSSIYLPMQKADKSLQLMLYLLRLLGRKFRMGKENEDTVAVDLAALLLSVVEPVKEFIIRRLGGELQELCDVDRASLYLSLLRELVKAYSHVSGCFSNLQKNCVSRLTSNCLRILSGPSKLKPSVASQVQKAVSMATLALLCELAEQHMFDAQSDAMRSLCSLNAYFYSSSSPLLLPCFNQTLLKPSSSVTDISGSHADNGPLLNDWGRVAAHYIRDQWICLSFLQKFATATTTTPPEVPFRAAVEALALLPSDLVLPVLGFMSAALPQVVLHDEILCVEAVTMSWKLVLASATNAHDFWPSLQAFVRLAFHHNILELTEAQSPQITACIQQITMELMELSQSKSGVLNVLIQHCCLTWLPSDPISCTDIGFQSAINHLDLLTEACVYGPVFRRDQRLIQEVQTYIEQLGEACTANAVINSENRDDQFPRLCVLAFLSRLDSSNGLHQTLMMELVQRLLKKDEEISKSKVRYYSNSIQHRIKNRVWQTLLILLPKLSPEFVVEHVLGSVCEAGFCSNQASVKYLIEWILILILHQNPSQIQRLWDCFSVDQEKTKTSICTFLSVLVHLDILLPNLQDKVTHWQKAVEVILLWCFNHNFTVRLYALLALKRVWGMEEARMLAENNQGGAVSLSGLATVVHTCLHQAEAMQNSGNALKNWSRIQEHFFFSAFHPLKDYSLETIFYTFPSLAELADDEWVPVWKFKKLVDFHSGSTVPLRNTSCELSKLQPGDWIQQDRVDLDQEERWTEVQKKITPWRLSMQEQEPQLMAHQRAARLGKLTNALIVVASLIDKPTNLGGLCRTCEIFGASALVLNSLRNVSDKQFQALSVSSELWLPLLEVKPIELAEFLQLKKREGYCVVGVEQTANSQSLQDYRFPEKTLLLLGNERGGIPANLLQLLDICVEIPQQGVTRSLNVHVSAALLVWEYTRQHLCSAQAS